MKSYNTCSTFTFKFTQDLSANQCKKPMKTKTPDIKRLKMGLQKENECITYPKNPLLSLGFKIAAQSSKTLVSLFSFKP